MDLKVALRALRNHPGFTLIAVLVLALGIGANTAVFSVVNAVLLRPLPYQDPDRILSIWSLHRQGHTISQVSAPDFRDWRAQNTVFESMAYHVGGRGTVVAGSEAEQATIARVTEDFFRVLGVEPALGRLFAAREEMEPVVLGDAFWRRNFGGTPAAIGKPVKMYEHVFTVVGVMPPGFQFPGETDVWMRANTLLKETTSRTAHNYRVVARLKQGVTLEQAGTQMNSIAARLEREYPDNVNKSVTVAPLRDQLVRNVRDTLYLLLGAVALVLLIACANVANLLLARASGRRREIAIRAAVGAGRARIIRQLITESAVLAVLAGGAALLLAVWGTELLIALAPANVPRLKEARLDGWVLAFTMAASLASSVAFGLAPALAASRVDLTEALKQGGRALATGASGRLRSALVVAEVALAVVLAAGAGLLIRSFASLQNVDPGFHAEGALVMESAVPASDLAGAWRAVRFYEELLRNVQTVPGAGPVALTRDLPVTLNSNGLYQIEGRPPLAPSEWGRQQANFRMVSHGYFRTLGIPLRRGRDFTETDRQGAPMTVIVSEALARESFPKEDPIGKRIRWGYDAPDWMTIVGVVGDVRRAMDLKPEPEMYAPFPQHPFGSTSLTLVARGGPALAEPLRRAVHSLNAEVPVRFTTVDAKVTATVASPRFRTLLLSVFAALAVALAMAGVYGVMACVVGQRWGEIGLRVALGAKPVDVLGLVFGQWVRLAAAGIALGLAGALAGSRLLSSFLFDVRPSDPGTYVTVTAAVGFAALAAALVPALRAMRVDPVVAVRQE